MLPCKLKPPLLRGNRIRKKSGKDLTTKRPTPSNQQYKAVEFCYNDNGCIKFLASLPLVKALVSSCFGLKCTKMYKFVSGSRPRANNVASFNATDLHYYL